MNISRPIREAQIEITVIRADGTREELGTVSYWHKNPLRRLFWRFKIWMKGLLR